MELQQERIVKERKLQHEQRTALQQYIIDELNKIHSLMLLSDTERKFVGRATLYLMGKGPLTQSDFDLLSGFDWRDNARLFFVTAIVYTLARPDITPVRFEHMVEYLRRHPYLDDELNDRLEGLTGMRAWNVFELTLA